MSKTSARLRYRLSSSTLLCLTAISLAPLSAFADSIGEGRPVSPVPVGANVTQIAPGDSAGFVYEKARIKRTVSLDPAPGLAGRWDALYSVQDTTGGNAAGLRTTYVDWDDNYLYVALETPAPEQVRFDLDLADDGWLRGADNLTLIVTPPAAGTTDMPKLTAQRFDVAQNKDQPVWAASPIPAEEIKVKTGQSAAGTYAVMLAIPRTEAMGLERAAGKGLGIRVDAASPTLPPIAGETALVPVRPMLRLALSEEVDASIDGLTISVNIDGPHDITPGGEVRATLEVKNESNKTQRLSRLYLKGSLGDSDNLDEQKFAGADIEPGKSWKRSIHSSVAPAAPFGNLVLRGGGDLESGMALAALTSFRKVEPYTLTLDVDSKPVPAGGENNTDARRSVNIYLRSHVNDRVTAKVKLILPAGWKLDSGELVRDLALKSDGEQQAARYKVIIPHTANLGPHTIGAEAEVGGRTYKATGTITLIP